MYMSHGSPGLPREAVFSEMNPVGKKFHAPPPSGRFNSVSVANPPATVSPVSRNVVVDPANVVFGPVATVCTRFAIVGNATHATYGFVQYVSGLRAFSTHSNDCTVPPLQRNARVLCPSDDITRKHPPLFVVGREVSSTLPATSDTASVAVGAAVVLPPVKPAAGDTEMFIAAPCDEEMEQSNNTCMYPGATPTFTCCNTIHERPPLVANTILE
jgi:hypothetical protein